MARPPTETGARKLSGYQFPQRGLASQADTATIENAQVPRSKFLNVWTRKTAFDAGKLIPILCDEILPGDHMQYEVTAYIRMSTPLFPMFDGQRVDTHFFFVPNRIVWANWIRFMGEQDTPGASIAFTVPRVPTTLGGDPVGSIYDHFNVPVLGQIVGGGSQQINALPFRAYNLIYNQWFRDENLSVAAAFTTADGPDTNSWYNILKRSKSHDYFTSALPWPQKFTAPLVPIGGLAPVTGIGKLNQNFSGPGSTYFTTAGTETFTFASGPIDLTAANSNWYIKGTAATSGSPQIYADLALASGVDINQLRQAWMVQGLLERDARGGTRYVELLRSHWGVISPDFRLQRPEYIGGGQSQLTITPIAQTAPTTGVPLGAIGGAGTAAGQHRASYAATEHGYIIGLISVKSELSYQQGLERHWKRQTRFDYAWPELVGLGEQAILQMEIYCTGAPADFNVWGYQERYQEYRTKQSEVTGIMRSTAASTIDQWHLAEKFLVAPGLNQTFVEENPPMTRILAAAALANGQQYLADIQYRRTAIRPLPTHGTPVTMGRM